MDALNKICNILIWQLFLMPEMAPYSYVVQFILLLVYYCSVLF